jgi:hypothetical protein
MNHKPSLAVAAVVAGLLASPALAQSTGHAPAKTEAAHDAHAAPGGVTPGSGGMPMMGQGMMDMMGRDGMSGMGAMMASHVEGRIAFLKTELKITEPQQKLWDAVADAMRTNARGMGGMPGGMAMTGSAATLPDNLATREKTMAAHLEQLRTLKAAVAPLYAALGDEQKKTADELMSGPMGMGRM